MATIQPCPRGGFQADSKERQPGSARGFTLVELVTTITIVALLATMAGPSFTQTISRTRSKSAATDLIFSLLKARSEAVKRNSPVTLSAKPGGWQNGWRILDPVDPSNPSLEDHIALPAGVVISSAVDSVVYQSSGRIPTGSAISFSIGASGAHRCVSIDPSGRPYAKESTC